MAARPETVSPLGLSVQGYVHRPRGHFPPQGPGQGPGLRPLQIRFPVKAPASRPRPAPALGPQPPATVFLRLHIHPHFLPVRRQPHSNPVQALFPQSRLLRLHVDFQGRPLQASEQLRRFRRRRQGKAGSNRSAGRDGQGREKTVHVQGTGTDRQGDSGRFAGRDPGLTGKERVRQMEFQPRENNIPLGQGKAGAAGESRRQGLEFRGQGTFGLEPRLGLRHGKRRLPLQDRRPGKQILAGRFAREPQPRTSQVGVLKVKGPCTAVQTKPAAQGRSYLPPQELGAQPYLKTCLLQHQGGLEQIHVGHALRLKKRMQPKWGAGDAHGQFIGERVSRPCLQFNAFGVKRQAEIFVPAVHNAPAHGKAAEHDLPYGQPPGIRRGGLGHGLQPRLGLPDQLLPVGLAVGAPAEPDLGLHGHHPVHDQFLSEQREQAHPELDGSHREQGRVFIRLRHGNGVSLEPEPGIVKPLNRAVDVHRTADLEGKVMGEVVPVLVRIEPAQSQSGQAGAQSEKENAAQGDTKRDPSHWFSSIPRTLNLARGVRTRAPMGGFDPTQKRTHIYQIIIEPEKKNRVYKR